MRSATFATRDVSLRAPSALSTAERAEMTALGIVPADGRGVVALPEPPPGRIERRVPIGVLPAIAFEIVR